MSETRPPDQQAAAGDDEEEDQLYEESGYKQSKDAVLFAIDISKSMLSTPEHVDDKRPDAAMSPGVAALKCAYALMQQRIISNPNDMMGILLFGTAKSRFKDGDDHEPTSSSGLQYPHCYLLTDLDIPAAADVKMLRNLVENEDEQEVLRATDDEVNMSNVLFCVNQIFTMKAPNFNSRRLFLVTDNDYPHANSRDARNSAIVRAKDLFDLGVTIELFPISHPDRDINFDRSKFYDDIIYSATPADPDAPAPLTTDIKAASADDGISLLQALISSVMSRAAPRRAIINNLPFEIGPGLKISVKGFIIIKRQEPKRTSYIYLPDDNSVPLLATGASAYIAEDTARSVEKVEVRKAFKFGGETISFTPEELSKIKNFGDPILRIVGFKPLALIPTWANTKGSTFIYPSEDEYVGSTRVFSALYQKLLRDQKVGLAWYIARRNAVPCIVALIPGEEQRDDSKEQTMPPGFWLKPLPFADDIRQPPSTTLVRAPDNVVDAMRVVVQQLQLPKGVYDPYKYPNPALQWFYRILQALALEEDLPEKPDDKTLPRARQISKRAGEYIIEWGLELDTAFKTWQAEHGKAAVVTGGVKRSAPTSTVASKKIKTEDDVTVDEAAVRKRYSDNSLSKLTVKQLKDFLATKNQGKALSKKADLVDAVTRHFETAMDVG